MQSEANRRYSAHTHDRRGALARLDDANRIVRQMGETIDRVAAEEGWPAPFRPLRALLLHHLDQATPFGIPPVRLSRLLRSRPSSLAHHLDVLEDGGLVRRQRRGFGDGRKVAVRLRREGDYAVRRLERALGP